MAATSRKNNWNNEASTYLLSYFAHIVSLDQELDYGRARDVIAKRFEHLDANNRTEKAVESKLLRLAASLGTTLGRLRTAVRDKGIDFAFSGLPEDEREQIHRYQDELEDSSLATAVVLSRPRPSEASAISNTPVSALHKQSNMRLERTDGKKKQQNSTAKRLISRSGSQQTAKRKRIIDDTQTPEHDAAESIFDYPCWAQSPAVQEDVTEARGLSQHKEMQTNNTEARYEYGNFQHEELKNMLKQRDKDIYDKDVQIAALEKRNDSTEQKRAHEREEMRSFIKTHDSSESSLGTRSFLERPADFNSDSRAQKMLNDITRPIRLPRDSPLFPSVLEPMHILRKWQYCREQVWSITRQELLSPQAVAAERIPEGFAPFLVKLFGGTRSFPIHEPGAAIRELNCPIFPDVLQAYAFDLLSEKTFGARKWYEIPFGENSSGMLAKWREIVSAFSGGIKSVQTLDAMAFKLVLEQGGEHFDRQVLPQQAANIATHMCQALEPFFADTDGYYPQSRDQRRATLKACAELLLRLKFELMLTPKQYEIEWTPAGTSFDGSLMQPTEGGRSGQEVNICVWPGLIEYDTTPVAQVRASDFASVLICNKSFFPGKEVVWNNRVVVAKSVVLLK